MTESSLVPELTTPLPSIWSTNGLLTWIASVDHKQIGIMYLLATLIFFGLGGVEALLLRTQLARPENALLSPEEYNQLFTLHGTTMIFFVVMPMLIGFATYFIPLMIGARDMLFPRLNALSLWLFICGGLLLYFSLLTGSAPNSGWFSYVPLSGKAYNTSQGIDYWILGLFTSGIGTILSGVNFIGTTLSLRAPGMTLRRLPLFVVMSTLNGILMIGALAIFNSALIMLFLERTLHMGFFNPDKGGDPLLWQHLFWAFGHPEVYIMVLPAFGMISEVIPVFARKPIFGYAFVAASSVAIVLLSFLVWGHHMFAVGLPDTLNIFFALASMMIAVPTGIKIFNWVATLWGGSIHFSTSMLFATAFLILFTIGGLSGVSFAALPVDWQTTDTYYVVAHMHYVLFGGTLFAIFGATYYWFPKMTGRLLSERLGQWHFWLTFVGFNTTFMVQHFLGLMGMPRRVYTYPADMPGWGLLNLVSTAGAYLLAVSVLVFLWNLLTSLRHGVLAGDNPWHGWTLEWLTTSPPPVHNFERVPPIHSTRPLWDLEHDRALTQIPWTQPQQAVTQPNYAPVVLAVGITFVLWGLAATWLLSLTGGAIIAGALYLWFMGDASHLGDTEEDQIKLPV